MRKFFPAFFVLLLVALFAVSCATPTNQTPTDSGAGNVTQASPGASPAAQPVKGLKENLLTGFIATVVFETPAPKGEVVGKISVPNSKKKIKILKYPTFVWKVEVGTVSGTCPVELTESGNFESREIDMWSPADKFKKYSRITFSMPGFVDVVFTNVPVNPEKPADLGKIVMKHSK